jgi:hypothetical protein
MHGPFGYPAIVGVIVTYDKCGGCCCYCRPMCRGRKVFLFLMVWPYESSALELMWLYRDYRYLFSCLSYHLRCVNHLQVCIYDES